MPTISNSQSAEEGRPIHDHPSLVNERWPCLFEESMDMLEVSILCYWIGDIRNMIKDQTLVADDDTVNALFHFPTSNKELSTALQKTMGILSNQKSYPDSQLYFSALELMSKRFIETDYTNPETFQLLRFEDEIKGKFGGPVYALAINHVLKRITIGFRGSVTTKDFICDWKTSFSNIRNPHFGEPNGGGEFIQVHHGFKSYLYDLTVETENSKGELEKNSLIHYMVSEVANLFEEYPDYDLYTTGHSLGAALATLFAMEAGASNDSRIKKPVTCIAIASPRVGNLSFAKLFMTLEESQRVRCFRVTNKHDIITDIPATANVNCFYISCCQYFIYRHVGVMCRLYTNKNPVIVSLSHYDHPTRLFFDDLRVQLQRLLVAGFWAPVACTCQTNIISNHSCKEYFKRILNAKDFLTAMHLDDFASRRTPEGSDYEYRISL